MQQKITTFLWFDDQAEEAARFYTSVFDDSRILDVQRYGEGGSREPGTVRIVVFQLAGQRFIACNGGPQFPFTEAISLQIDCDGQEEVDELWSRLGEGGEAGPCGWIKDKYGLSWQVVPRALFEALEEAGPEGSERVIEEMLTMGKLDVQRLRDAARG